MPIVELPNGQELEFPDGMSNEQMQTAIYKNFPQYAAMKQPVEQSENGSRGTNPSITNDVISSLMGLPGAALDFAKSIPGEVYGAGKQVFEKNPKRGAANIAAGALGLPHTVFNIPANIADYLHSRGKTGNFHPDLHVRSAPSAEEIAKILGVEGQEGGDALLRAATSFGPANKALKMLGVPARGAIAATAGGLAAGEGQDPLQAALLNEFLGGAGKAGGAISRNASIAKMLRGKLSPEDLARNLEVTEGTNTGLGQVIDNPYLQRLQENILAKVPLSGVSQVMQEVGNQIKDKGHSILEKLSDEQMPEHSGLEIQKALKTAEKETRAQKNQYYRDVDRIADENNIKAGRQNFVTKAREIADEINKSPELARELPAQLISDLNSYTLMRPGSDIKTANILKGKLGDKSTEFYSNDKHTSGIYGELKKALKADIDHAIFRSGSDELKNSYEKAEKFYGENYKPFEDPDIKKFTTLGGDADTIVSHFLRGTSGRGSTERSLLLTKLMDKLGERERKQFAHSYFSAALEDGVVNPNKLNALYKRLGPKQKAALFSDEAIKREFDNFSKLVGKNAKPLSVMFNPNTGQQAMDILPGIVQSGAGGAIGGLTGAIGGIAAPALGARVINHLLTSPKTREKLVNKMIGKEPPKTRNQLAMEKFKKQLKKSAKEASKISGALEVNLNKNSEEENNARG